MTEKYVERKRDVVVHLKIHPLKKSPQKCQFLDKFQPLEGQFGEKKACIPHLKWPPKTYLICQYMCHGQKSRFFGDGHPTFNRNPYNWYIKPYYWVDDHPLLYGNNGSLDPIAHMKAKSFYKPSFQGQCCNRPTAKLTWTSSKKSNPKNHPPKPFQIKSPKLNL